MSDPARPTDAGGVRNAVRFGEFLFDPSSGQLSRDGESVALAPQPARVLEVLVARAGEVVTREELYEAVWGDDVHVDYRQGLNYCMRQVRIALDEDASDPRFIETLPRRGYRFLPAVEVVSSGSRRAPSRRSRARAAAAMILAAVAITVWMSAPGAGPSDLEVSVERTAASPGRQPYLRARYLAGKEIPEPGAAVEQYEEALRLDPELAPAWSGLAAVLTARTVMGALPAAEGHGRAIAAADRALALGHRRAEPYLARGGSRLYRDLDWDGALEDFDRARTVEPSSAPAWFWYARALAATGRHAEALEAGDRSLLLDPDSRQIVVDLGWFELFAGRYEQAVAQCERALELEPGSIPALRCLIGARVGLDDSAGATEAAERLLREFGAPDEALEPLRGRRSPEATAWESATRWIGDLCPANSFATTRAVLYTLAGDTTAAREQLRSVVDRRLAWAPFVALDPTFAEVLKEPVTGPVSDPS